MRSLKEVAKTVQEQGRQTGQAKTLVEILGRERVLVEHHKGILRYDITEILLGATYGKLRIQGEALRLCCMSREQLCISGRICSIIMEGCG